MALVDRVGYGLHGLWGEVELLESCYGHVLVSCLVTGIRLVVVVASWASSRNMRDSLVTGEWVRLRVKRV